MQVVSSLDVHTVSDRRARIASWAWRLAPVWTGLGALLLDVILIGRQSVRADEAQAVKAATGTWGNLWDHLRAHEAPHAVYDVLLKGWLALGGTDEWALRAPAALCGALAVGLTCALGARLYGRVVGVVAAAVLATSVLMVEWSQRGHGATLALAAVVAATLAFVAAVERPAWWRWALWGAACAAAVAVSLLAVSVLVAHAAAFAARRPRGDWRAPVVALAVVVAVAVAGSALVLASHVRHVGGLRLPDGLESLDGLWNLTGLSPVPVAVAGLGVFALITSRVRGAETWSTVLLGTWLAAPVVVGLAVSLARPAFDPGYALTAAPALALLAGAGVVSQRRWVALGVVVLLGAVAAYRLAEWYTGSSTEDWRGAVEEIRGGQRAGEAVIVLPTRQGVAAAYYAGEGFTVERPRGRRVWLLLAIDGEERRLRLGRKLVHPPRYALLEDRRYGDGLWLQVWAVP